MAAMLSNGGAFGSDVFTPMAIGQIEGMPIGPEARFGIIGAYQDVPRDSV
ncbi:MAG TPA: hypothetical protein VKT74_04430 [Gammaproteobacteria bacterium]|nr:hypothetical protein [Gammaproteobacteria bacterium]